MTTPSPATLEGLQEICTDITTMVAAPNSSVDTKRQIASMEDSINSSLRRLDEFGAIVQSIESNTQQSSHVLIPQLEQDAQHLQELYAKIGQFAIYLNRVEKNVSELEAREADIARAYDTSTLGKFFSFMSGSAPKTKASLEWKQLDTVEAKDYFQ